jgi:hypothetical protein
MHTKNSTNAFAYVMADLFYIYSMSTILIKADKQSNKILSELAIKLGGEVIGMKENQFEEVMLGLAMDKVKTGKTVSKESILKKLRSS